MSENSGFTRRTLLTSALGASALILVADPLKASAAGLTSASSTAASASATVVSQVAKNGTKGYLQVDGKPFLMYGVQNFGHWQIFGNGLNPDSVPVNWSNPILSEAWLENVFEKTAAAGFQMIQIELSWRTIQPTTAGQYDFHIIDKYITWAKKYNLKIDFIWFGTNGVGGAVFLNAFHGFIATVPDYLTADQYWQSTTVSGDQRRPPLLPISGETYYDTATYLFQQEQAAVKALFNHLAVVDTTHQTILFDLYNEPDAYPYFSSGGAQTTAWRTLVDQLGAAVKTSNYVVATRMNFQRAHFADATRRQVYSTFLSPNVDFIGADSYDHNPANQVGYVDEAISAGSPIGYIPETGGNSNDKMPVLASVLADGGFLDFWMLNDAWATTVTSSGGIQSGFSFYGDSTNVTGFQSYTSWTLGTIPALPASSQRVKNFNVGLNKMGSFVAAAEKANMRAFNASTVAASQPVSTTDTQTLGSRTLAFTTTTRDVALAVLDPASGYIYVISDTAGSVTLNAGTGRRALIGQFNSAGNWNTTTTRTLASDGSFTLNTGELVKIE